MAKPAVIIVGADKGGVGKTTVARTLLDYFTAHQIPTRAFDTEAPKGTLKRFHPDLTDVVDMTHVPDQMKIFDTLNSADATVTVIDVRAGLMSPTLKALRDIGFIEAAKKGQITFAVFHILGPSIASLDEIAETATYLGDAKYFMVKNFINNHHFFEWDEATHASYFKTDQGRGRSHDPASSTRWRASRSNWHRCRTSPSSRTRSRAARPRPIRSCCAAMSATGSATSGPSTTASGSATSSPRAPRPPRCRRPRRTDKGKA